MKDTVLLIISMFVIISLFFSCVSTKTEPPGKEILYKLTGAFYPESHSTGTMEWVLYTDGSLEGSWVTKNNTFTLQINGFYIIKNESIAVFAFGSSMLRAETESRVMIFATGSFSNSQGLGSFYIFIEDPAYPDDKGTWEVWEHGNKDNFIKG